MSLIRLLQEASTLPIDGLKKAMMKDKLASLLFKKDLTLDSIEDKDAFLASVKYWLLNNESVQNFIALRHNVKDLDKDTLATYRKMRGKDLDANKLKWLSEFARDIFKEHASVERATLSPDLKRELRDWMNGNGRYFNLPGWAQRELMSIPSLRPDKRILIYRGLLFSEWSFKEEEKYDGSLEVGNGLKFVRAIKKGDREVKLTWDRPSSWSKSKEVATRFVQHGPASSNYAATLQWLERSMKKKHIDGLVGYVVSTFANPEDILLDTARLDGVGGHLQHGDEGEVIMKAGTYMCRIMKKYTVDEGEVSPDETETANDSQVPAMVDEVKKFASTFKLPEVATQIELPQNIWPTDGIELVKFPEEFRKLVSNSTTTQLIHAYDQLNDWYKNTLHKLPVDELKPDRHARDVHRGRQAAHLKKIHNHFNERVNHSKLRSDTNSKGEGKAHQLNGEEFRATVSPFDVRSIEKDLMTRGTISKNSSREFSNLGSYLGVKGPGSAPLHMFGSAKQKPYINETIDKFFKMVGLDRPADDVEAKKTMINLLRKASRNYEMIKRLKKAKEQLGAMV